jgi:hypothetical protein
LGYRHSRSSSGTNTGTGTSTSCGSRCRSRSRSRGRWGRTCCHSCPRGVQVRAASPSRERRPALAALTRTRDAGSHRACPPRGQRQHPRRATRRWRRAPPRAGGTAAAAAAGAQGACRACRWYGSCRAAAVACCGQLWPSGSPVFRCPPQRPPATRLISHPPARPPPFPLPNHRRRRRQRKGAPPTLPCATVRWL